MNHPKTHILDTEASNTVMCGIKNAVFTILAKYCKPEDKPFYCLNCWHKK